MKLKINFVALMAHIAFLSSCANMSSKFETEKIKNVRSVAIVAVEIHQKKTTDNLGLGKLKSAMSGGSDSESPEMQSMISKVVDTLGTQLQQKTNWKVISQKVVLANTQYQKMVEEKMSGLRHATVKSADYETVIPNGMLDATNFAALKPNERAQLAKALSVDAVVEIMMVNGIEQSMFSLGHISGDGDFAMKGTARLQVFEVSSEDPIWRSKHLEGSETENSDKLPKSLSRRQKLSILAEKASVSAIQKVVDTFVEV